jgi:hypothetical protein
MRTNIINGLLACVFLVLTVVLKLWIFHGNPVLGVAVQYLLLLPFIYFTFLTLFPKKSIGILQLTVIILLYAIVSSLPEGWHEILYKATATIIGGLGIGLFKHYQH